MIWGEDTKVHGLSGSREHEQNTRSVSRPITAAIVHWNTVYLDRAVQQLRAQRVLVANDLLVHIAARLGTHRHNRRRRLVRSQGPGFPPIT
jgi:Tn3 transposase DDE domain